MAKQEVYAVRFSLASAARGFAQKRDNGVSGMHVGMYDGQPVAYTYDSDIATDIENEKVNWDGETVHVSEIDTPEWLKL